MHMPNICQFTKLFGCLLLAAAPVAVQADLTYENVNGVGLIYDSVDNTTWTQNADISGTTFTYQQANAWADSLTIPGVDSTWELPTATEFGNLFLQLEAPAFINGYQNIPSPPYSGFKYGPTVAFGSGPNDYASDVQTTYWTADSKTDFNFSYGFGGTYDNANTFAAWAIEPTPEPSAGLMGLITSGLLAGGMCLRRRVVLA